MEFSSNPIKGVQDKEYLHAFGINSCSFVTYSSTKKYLPPCTLRNAQPFVLISYNSSECEYQEWVIF